MALSGAVFINRKNKHDAIKAFDQVGNDMKRKGVSRRKREAFLPNQRVERVTQRRKSSMIYVHSDSESLLRTGGLALASVEGKKLGSFDSRSTSH